MRMEVVIWDPPLIPAMPFRPALYLPLRPSLLMAFLRSFSVRPLLRLLRPPVVLTRLWMPISTLRFLVLPALALRSHLPPVSTLRLLIVPIITATIFGPLFLRPRLLLPILRLRTLLLIIFVLVLLVLILRDGHPRRSQKQRSANPNHD